MDILRSQQSGYRKLIGSLDRLVQVSARPGQFVLKLPVKQTEVIDKFELLLDIYVGMLRHG